MLNISNSLLKKIKNKLNFLFSKKPFDGEKIRLQNLPRFIETETILFKKTIKIVDASSYLFLIKEIFDQQIYKFTTNKKYPLIIDCGANIGLSVIYFKQLYPNSHIIAFEPDNKVFDALLYNINSFEFTNVELIKKACWDMETTLEFFSEGADAGRKITKYDHPDNTIKVEATRLKNFLDRKIDFLKIDIEGAEFVVLNDIRNELKLVDNIFVEYHSFPDEEQMLPELVQILKNAGFRLHISSPGLTSAHPFVERSEYLGMDNQLNIYGFRAD